MIFLQALPNKAPAAPIPAQAPQLKGAASPRIIAEDDLLDKLGLGAWADVAVMSSLAIFLGCILTGILLWVFRKAFGSREDMQKMYNDSERMVFDLIKRKAEGSARIEGLKRQIDAITTNLNKVR
jgi:hypothetical protein